MERIDPQSDHQRLRCFGIGREVEFSSKRYVLQRRTTLASGEAAVVLRGENEQFVISAAAFLKAAKPL